jgi:hypothetical protein
VAWAWPSPTIASPAPCRRDGGPQLLCNGLAATVGLGQVRVGGIEPGLVTSGDGLGCIRAMLGDRDDYSAADVVTHLMSDVPLGVSR